MPRIPLVLLGALATANAMAQSSSDKVLVWDETSELIDWQRAVRDFRREHNFAIILGRSSSNYDGRLDGMKDFRFQSVGTELGLAYAFHIPWGAGFGYSLGTSASTIFGEKSDRDFSVHYRARLPGVELGLVWNASNHFRLGATFIYGWERIDQLRLSEELDHRKLSLTGETVAYRMALDYFYQLTWAVRTEYESSAFCYPSKKNFCYAGKEKHELEKSTQAIRVGIVKHLL